MLARQALEGRDPGLVLLYRVDRLSVLVEGVRLVLVYPDPDQGAGHVAAKCQAVQRLAGEILLKDLGLENDAVGSVLCHGRRTFECPTQRSNQFNPTVRPLGPTPSFQAPQMQRAKTGF